MQLACAFFSCLSKRSKPSFGANILAIAFTVVAIHEFVVIADGAYNHETKFLGQGKQTVHELKNMASDAWSRTNDAEIKNLGARLSYYTEKTLVVRHIIKLLFT